MFRLSFCCLWSIATALVFWLPAAGEDWPCWRGPRGDGTSLETSVPVAVERNGQHRLEGGSARRWAMPRPSSGRIASFWSRAWSRRAIGSCCAWIVRPARPCGGRRWSARRWRKSISSTATPRARRPPTARPCTCRSSTASDGRGGLRSFRHAQVARAAGRVPQQARLLQLPGAVRRQGDRQRRPRRRRLPGGPRPRRRARRLWKIDRENKTRSYCTPLIRQIDGRRR